MLTLTCLLLLRLCGFSLRGSSFSYGVYDCSSENRISYWFAFIIDSWRSMLNLVHSCIVTGFFSKSSLDDPTQRRMQLRCFSKKALTRHSIIIFTRLSPISRMYFKSWCLISFLNFLSEILTHLGKLFFVQPGNLWLHAVFSDIFHNVLFQGSDIPFFECYSGDTL